MVHQLEWLRLDVRARLIEDYNVGEMMKEESESEEMLDSLRDRQSRNRWRAK